MSPFCCGSDVFSLLVLLQNGPILVLSLRFFLCLKILSIPSVFLTSIEIVLYQFFAALFVMITRFVIQLGVFSATNRFPTGPGPSLFDNECACCERTDTIDDVLENLFLVFGTLAPRSTRPNLQYVCSCVTATRPALYCVCLFMNSVPGILGHLLVLVVVVFWKEFRHQFVLVRRLKNLLHQ